MIAKIRERMAADEGFTLIELLVVVIIIGILAAIAIPTFLNQRERAWVSSVESDLRNAAIDFETYYTENDDYEATITDGQVPTTGAAANTVYVEFSDGVTLTGNTETATGVQTFCLTGSHANFDGGAAFVWYDSDAGGLTDTAC